LLPCARLRDAFRATLRRMMSTGVGHLDLNGKRALVCGSSQGIGRACAQALATLGASVSLVARDERALSEVRASLPGSGDHRVLAADFADWQRVRDAVAKHVNECGPAHVLVNNTGGPPAGAAMDAAPEQFAAAFAMHVLCNQVLVQAVVPGMKAAKFGRIVNIISTSVITPIRGLGVSNTIRGAVANWAKTLAAELGPFGITVNNVLPGFTATARLDSLIRTRASKTNQPVEAVTEQMRSTIPAGRFADATELSSVVAFLASPAASYVNGVNLPVDGGRLAAQ
jgi:3-oxoacyl-[acyl-carrier protein] reductase